ncbi:MAG TPA: ABC transporter permease [Terracidiphilus sp.]|nr:ABC transporter permease [Terracidiphilus sp.]
MKWWQKLYPQSRSNVDREIQAHIDMAIQDRVDQGKTYEEARASVLREFGNVGLVKDVDAEMSGMAWLRRLHRDIRYALRRLRNSPLLSLTVVFTLAVAIGASASVFSLVHAILLRSLPFDDPARVLSVENGAVAGLYDTDPKQPAASFNADARSFTTIENAAQYSNSSVNAVFPTGMVRHLRTTETSAGFLKVLGLAPELGRSFLPEEETPGKDRVVLISDRLWRGTLDSDPSILGRTVKLNGADFTVIGVLSPQMDFPSGTDLWTPTVFDMRAPTRNGGAFMTSLIVRARAGVSVKAVQAEFAARALRIHAEESISKSDLPLVIPISRELTKSIRSSLMVLTIAVALVLLLACANVAGLCLVRVAERRQELAVCTALGAPASHLIRQELVEYLLLALSGGMIGIGVAGGVLRVLYGLRPSALNGFPRPELDPTVLGFAVAIALASGLIFGVGPALAAGRQNPSDPLRAGIWRSSAIKTRTRKALVVGEVAIAVVLAVGTGLLVRSLANLNRVPLGFNVDQILSFSVSTRGGRYSPQTEGVRNIEAFVASALHQLAAIPGVIGAGAVNYIPLDPRADMLLPMRSGASAEATVMASPRVASDGYFKTMGIAILEGRTFSSHDDISAPKVVIVTSDLADKLWPGESPIGRQMYCAWPCKPSLTVVGVIGPIRRFGPRDDAISEYYMPFTQQSWTPITFVLHTASDPSAMVSAVRKTLSTIDPTLPIYGMETMRDRLNDRNALARFELFTLSAFAAIATLLVSIGLYGFVSYTVAQRSREIGLRIALGAEHGKILLRIVREGMYIATVGAGLGMVSSFALGKLLAAALFGVTAHDSITLLGVALLFIGIAVAASYLPARRVASIDPAITLRAE